MIVGFVEHEDGRRKARNDEREDDRNKYVVAEEFRREPSGPEQNDDCQHAAENGGQEIAEECNFKFQMSSFHLCYDLPSLS